MELVVGDHTYLICIEKKKTTKHTYLRVREDGSLYVTTNPWTKDQEIMDLVKKHQHRIEQMQESRIRKNQAQEQFSYLGKIYDKVYVESQDLWLGEEKVFLSKNYDVDGWYKKQAQCLFQDRLRRNYEQFTQKIPEPSLKIRKMKSRWGVCNTKTHVITLNLELIKKDLVYLDYVIMHELSHLVHPNHSVAFWSLVEENCPTYKIRRREMRTF